MTLSAVQKAEMDRSILLMDIVQIERKITSHTSTPLRVSQAESLLDTLSKIKPSLIEVHSRIAYQAPADIADHETTYIDLNERLSNAKADLMEILRALAAASSTVPTCPTASTSHIRLPDIQLPSFDGKYEDWLSFEDLFQATVGKNLSLSNAQKLQYLKSCVKGDAANLIKSFIITDQNYNEAWTLLSNRYNNKSEIVYSLCKKILYQPHLKTESVTGLQQLQNVTMESVRSLKVMGQPIDTWDSLLVVSVVEKFDPDTRSEWAKARTTTNPATFQEVIDFLEKHIRGLLAKGALNTKPSNSHNSNSTNNKNQSTEKQRSFRTATAAPANCGLCKGTHQLYQCTKLHEMDASQRSTAVRRTTACLNCLRDGHSAKDCRSTHTCRKCSMKHHTLLHNDQQRPKPQSSNTNIPSAATEQQSTVRTNVASSQSSTSQRVFKTAVVDIQDSTGVRRQCRVLFDDCSEAEYITDSCASALGLKRFKTNVIIEGVAEIPAAHCKSKVTARLLSRVSNHSVLIENLLVMPKITGYVPRLPHDQQNWTHLQGLQLADPNYHLPGEIDILIGTGIVSYIMEEGIKRGKSSQPVAFNSIFGWVISGIEDSDQQQIVRTHHTRCRLEELVQRFWEVEQIPVVKPMTSIEAKAEKHFQETHFRKPDGRYVVRLPFNSNKALIGETRELALNRLFQLEKRFKRYPEYKEQYIQFMKEYHSLGHMELVSSTTLNKRVYIPHHFVCKEDSSTTKLRVVFDASMKSSSGISLNDALLVGPTIQDELFTQLIRFRTYQIALKADIAKMYRQFEVMEDDRDYQTILWRDDPSKPVQEFRLTTVTYGTACAPFLATRCLQQLSIDEEERFPKAAKIVKQLMYIDDLLGGQETKEDCLDIYHELNNLCSAAGLQIRKWCSSDHEVLAGIPSEMKEEGFHDFGEDSTVKALGIRWKAAGDYFYFQVDKKEAKSVITKREVLSEIARTFDPIGWLTPTTVIAKILFQDLWKETTNWDAPVSREILMRWNQYCADLQEHIVKIKIPRLLMCSDPVNVQVYGFSDSSEKCMACCIYLRSVDSDGHVRIQLVTSKSKIAPIKQISIPRLELNSAVLLAECLEAAKKFGSLLHQKKWKAYVATRVATILEVIPARCWHHVRSADNPADLPSRGISPSELVNSKIWWHGPVWLTSGDLPFSTTNISCEDKEEIIREERVKVTTLLCSTPTPTAEVLFQFSSLVKVMKTVGWLCRFLNFISDRKTCAVGPLTPDEKSTALNNVLKYVQRSLLSEDVRLLKLRKPVSIGSKLSQLHPYLDENGIVRVGGRLSHANMESNFKNPIVIPHNHRITSLLISHYHEITLHGGFTLTSSLLRRKYWILRGRDTIRFFLRKCVTCRKAKASLSNQLMGNLPAARVSPNRPFSHCGVDFAGSFPVRMRSGRGPTGIDKIYMAVFICFSTKAVHLEAVTGLSTSHFLACFRRFTARRGIPSHMYSDCGTNFVGADKELQNLLKQNSTDFQQQVSERGTQWVFNPPSAPHQGGLWEAAVKSAKYHIKRIVGNNITTFEQFCTLLCNVEACLNSRPLCPLSSDPTDLDALTPGHFLIGQPLLSVPEGDLTMVKENRLDHWQRVQQMTQHFWKRWQHEYLVLLQQRQKWNKVQKNISIGDLVIIRDENLPPTKWKLGRITAVHPGDDGLVRKATVLTATGEFIRPIARISHLSSGCHTLDVVAL